MAWRSVAWRSVAWQVLGPGDEDRLRALRERALRADPDAFWHMWSEEVDQPRSFWTERLTSAAHWLVAVEDGPAGARDVAVGAVTPDYEDPDDLAVVAVWIDPDVRGRGLAGQLVDRLMKHARGTGAPGLRLWSADANVAAVALYAARGFAPTGRTGRFLVPRDHITEHERRLPFGSGSDG